MKKSVNIGIIIVTYNRLSLLKNVLKNYDNQTKIPKYILIINNASDDGTLEYLTYWKSVRTEYKRIVINLDNNIGGSGGFYTGLAIAEKLEADWIWVSDDDAFPKEDALEETERYLCTNANFSNHISAICGMVINNGQIDIAHRRWIKRCGIYIKDKKIPKNMYKDCFELNAFSYVGTIINRKILLKAGLPEKNYFIWWDDTEHSIRLSKYGKIICVPNIKIYHNVKKDSNNLTWKYYYGWRNKTNMYKKHFSKLCYTFFYYSNLAIAHIKVFLGYEADKNKIRIIAIKDADTNKLGLHDEYKPGWVSNKNNL